MLVDDLVRLGTAVAKDAPVFLALVEALEGGVPADELMAQIKAAQIKATEAAVEADLGEPHPQ
jgi:hypothetical protein